MIVYLVGVPGAGKTYFAVNSIFENVKKDKYNITYTNINQFKLNFGSKVKKFHWDRFYKDICELYTISKDTSKNDDDLIAKVKELGYYKSYIVIDECHNYLDNLDKVLTWLFSYHRHIFIDFLLITQNLALVETKYKKFAEFFVRAVPTSLNLFSNTFTYKKFIDSRLSAKSHSGTDKIKKDKVIFDLYSSGDSVKTQNVIKKYLLYFFIGCVITLLFFYYVINSMKESSNQNLDLDSKVKVSKIVKKETSFKNYISDDSQTFTENKKEKKESSSNYYFIECVSSSCKFKNYSYVFVPKMISSLILEFNCKQIFKNENKNFTDFLLKCDDMSSVLDLFSTSNKNNISSKKDFNNDKKNNIKPITSSFFKHK